MSWCLSVHRSLLANQSTQQHIIKAKLNGYIKAVLMRGYDADFLNKEILLGHAFNERLLFCQAPEWWEVRGGIKVQRL